MKLHIALASVATVLVSACGSTRVDVPEYQAPPGELVHLEQGWTEDEWHEFHYTPQGTRLLPYDWFMALEQPCLAPWNCGALSDPEYLARFGFLTGATDARLNPDGLPIGFARQEGFADPDPASPIASDTVVGLTCAACHTGELHWNDYAIRIEGGPAMIDVGEFQKALGLAVGLTKTFPFSLWRYGRFEEKVLGASASDEAKAALETAVEATLALGRAAQEAEKDAYPPEYNAGFARTDALARIGNQIFASNMRNNANLVPATAPVRFPQLWDASWLDWVQYNSSIADPLVRNIGESLGVRAVLKLYGEDRSDFNNTVDVAALRHLEELLSGPAPFEGLTSPPWPDVFPDLDPAKVAEGDVPTAVEIRRRLG